ncbi:MAG: lysophospholipid acyltransferase family protein [Pseudomonadota bacterium]
MDAKQDDLLVADAIAAAGSEDRIGRLALVVSATRTRLFELYVFVVSLAIGAVVLVYLRWTREPRQVRTFLRIWSQAFIYGARYVMGVGYRIEGLENIPAQPVLFVGNHQSYWESIAMTAIIPHINVVTKRQAMAIPVFGWGLRYAPMTPIDRDAPGQNIRRMVRDGRTCMAEGRSMLIFPEGRRVTPGKHRKFSRGFETLYSACDAPVVPFVTDAGLHWPVGFTPKRPGVVTLRFLPPISAGLDPAIFARKTERLLNEEKDRLLEESQRRRTMRV